MQPMQKTTRLISNVSHIWIEDKMETLTINRVLDGSRRGGSRPVIVDTPSGRHLVKLRGAAHQGSGALVSEIIVA